MRIDFKFRHVEQSTELTAHITEHIDRFEKFEHQPARAEFTFTHVKDIQRVDVHLRGKNLELHAHGEADNFFTAADQAMEKIERQLAKKKNKPRTVKKHAQSKVS
jgi:ribosomal subunit interface protein